MEGVIESCPIEASVQFRVGEVQVQISCTEISYVRPFCAYQRVCALRKMALQIICEERLE